METSNNFNESISVNSIASSSSSVLQNDKNQMDNPQNMTGTTAYQICYPEIFYRLQPYIFMVCDQMDTFGTLMPTQKMIEDLTDSIHDDVCKMYPEMSEFAEEYDEKENKSCESDTSQYGMYDRNYRMFDHRTRRRGMLRDLIDILLLQEFFRRRRRYY